MPTSDVDQFFDYDEAGNVLSIADTPGSGVRDIQCFTYDYLRRMTDAWSTASQAGKPCEGGAATSGVGGPAPYHHSYTYDKTGNRLSETIHAVPGQAEVRRDYDYPAARQAQPHTLRQVTETTPAGDRLYSYQYDKSGNTTTRTLVGEDQKLVWDAEGHLATATESGKTTSYLYDADGARLLRDEPDAVTAYLPGMELRLSKATRAVDGTRFYSITDNATVVRTTKGAQIQVADHHGTGQVAVDAVTGAITHRRSVPFGGPRGEQPDSGKWLGEKGFVGGTKDSTTGLTHLGAREYDPSTGRFVSVDPLIDVGDPQQMHGYSYANNSPATLSDPDGLVPIAANGGASEGYYWTKQPTHMAPTGPGGKWEIVPDVPKSTGSSGGPRPSESPEAAAARAAAERAKQTVIAVAKALGQILMDELGITDAVDCFIKGDMGGCFNTALNLVMSAIGGVAGKLIARYWNKIHKVKEIGSRLIDLGKQLKDSIGKWLKSRKIADDAADAAKNCNSFVPGTLVLMADGSYKALEDVDVGDEVVATDPKTGKTVGKTVVATIIGQGAKNLVRITIDLDGKGGDESADLVATDGHPFWVPQLREWLKATDLHAGQWLQTSAGTWVQITAVQRWTQQARVHNLTVDDIHTYYVIAGTTPVLVHNTSPESCPIFRTPKAADLEHELENGPNPASFQEGDRSMYFGEESVALEYRGRGTFANRTLRYDMKMPEFLEEFGDTAHRYDWQGPGGGPRIEFQIPVERLPRFNELTQDSS